MSHQNSRASDLPNRNPTRVRDYAVHLVEDASVASTSVLEQFRSLLPRSPVSHMQDNVQSSDFGDGNVVIRSQAKVTKEETNVEEECDECTIPEEQQASAPGVFDLVMFTIGLLHAFVTVAILLTWVFGPDEYATHGMAVTDYLDCSKVARDVLTARGTAVDAAVAAAFCMTVHYPHVASLGGGGYMLVHHHKWPEMSRVVDFRESAPATLTQRILDEGKIRSNTGAGFNGGVFVGVPGVPAGLWAAHKKFGRMKWKELLQPAITMAKTSRTLNDHLALACAERVHDRVWEPEADTLMKKLMSSATSTVDFKNDRLAETLELIAQRGVDAFYKGPLANKMAEAVKKSEGVLTKYDLGNYNVRWQKPLNMTWGNYTILTTGPPSGGLAAMLSLGYLMLNPDAHKANFGSPEALHLMMEAAKKALAEFGALGDPQFASYVKNRTETLIKPKMVEREARHIRKSHTLQPSETFPVLPETAGTEILVADDDDLYVSLVFGLNSYFGSRVETGGFFLNNAMGNFFPVPPGVSVPDPDSGANFLEPNKRPLTLAAPLMVVSSSHMCKTRLLAASSSFDVLTQVVASHFLFDKPLEDSVAAPRLHLGSPFGSRDYLTELHEPFLSEASVRLLEAKGITFSVLKGPYPSCHAILKYEEKLNGQADPRTDSLASTS